MKKIAIYSRKSIITDKGDSINNQIKIIKDYFRNEQCEFEIFEDEGFSGGNTKRPAFQQMMSQIRMGFFNTIAVYKIDRIARNIVDFVNTYDEFNKLGVNLVSVTEGFDPSTPYGKLVMMILATFAEMERSNISQRVKDNKIENAKMGKWTGGTLPFGYDTIKVEENNKIVTYLTPNKDIEKVVAIYNKYLELQSLHKVCKWIHEEWGFKWALSTVSHILKNSIYVKSDKKVIEYLKLKGIVHGTPNGFGIITYNVNLTKNLKKNTFYAISKNAAPLDSDIWIETQLLQSKNSIKPIPKSSTVSFISGLLRCGLCGSTMTITYNHVNKEGLKNYFYICTGKRKYGNAYCNSKNVQQHILDDYVLETLEKISIDDIVEDIDNSEEIKKIENKIRTNDRRIENLVDKLMDFTGTAAITIEKKIKDLTKENDELQKNLWNLNKTNTSTIDKFSLIKSAKQCITTSDHEGKRELLRTVIKQITVTSSNKNPFSIEWI